jgi:hypothetical protein
VLRWNSSHSTKNLLKTLEKMLFLGIRIDDVFFHRVTLLVQSCMLYLQQVIRLVKSQAFRINRKFVSPFTLARSFD